MDPKSFNICVFMGVFICPLSGFWEVSTMTGGWESNHSVGELYAIYIYYIILYYIYD